MVLEQVKTDIGNCADEIAEKIVLTYDQQQIIEGMMLDAFGNELSQCPFYIDNLAWDGEYAD